MQSLKYVHCDIKPGTIFISKGPLSKGKNSTHKFMLNNFRCCWRLAASSEEKFAGFTGTKEFLSPEMKRTENQTIGSFVDSYALGLTIFKMCGITKLADRKKIYAK